MAEDTQNPPEEELNPNETPGDEEVDDGLPKNEVAVEDAGTLRKKVTITIARERIEGKFDEMFGELGRTAQVPGFRIGRAPRRLIEKRFGREVSDDVRNAIVGEAVGSALEDEDLNVLGEPDIELDKIELPEKGELVFSMEVEVAPEFDLPKYKGIEIKRPALTITDEHVEQAVGNMLTPMGRLKPISGKAKEADVVEADVKIAGEGIDHAATNVELRVAPGHVEGIPIEDLAKALSGVKAGESVSLKTTVPSGHPNEQWRDKDVEISVDVKDVKRMEVPELTDELASTVGFGSADDLRDAARKNMEARLESDKQQAMRSQVGKFLVDNTDFDLPEGVTERHTARVLQRRHMELMMRGVGRDQIEQNLQQLQAEAAEQAGGDLKLSFILAKVAKAEGVEVDEGEVNARIAQIARRQNRRPERLRQELQHEGRLEQLATNIVEEKAVDKILDQAKVVDVTPEEAAAEKAEEAAAEKAKAAAKGKKKTTAKGKATKAAAKPKATKTAAKGKATKAAAKPKATKTAAKGKAKAGGSTPKKSGGKK